MDELQKRFETAAKEYLKKYFSNLNDMQKEAVFTVNGPVLILAGAGSGKTTVLVNRIKNMLLFGDAYTRDYSKSVESEEEVSVVEKALHGEGDIKEAEIIISHNTVMPHNVLAITFTNKAATELKERINAAVPGSENLQASTFHSACVRILRRQIDKLGYENDFAIYDTDDSQKIVKDCIEALGYDIKMYPPKSVLSKISHIKEEMKTPEMYRAEVGSDFRALVIAKVYSEYQHRLTVANAVDFDDIIFLTVRLFKEYPKVLEYYQNLFKYIMVDEYQDTNIAQYQLISLLSEGHKNLCVVGDDDQSIYGFRGATIENILGFEKEFPNAKVIKLEQNYRSTSPILNSANGIIAHNSERKGKNLWTAQNGGDKVVFHRAEDDRSEVFYITSKIKENVDAGGNYRDNAVLYRMNAQSAGFERVFIENGIPYKIFGGLKFFGRKEVKDITAYLNLINNPHDTVRFERVINVPKRGIGDKTVEAIEKIVAEEGLSYTEALLRSEEYASLHSKSAVLVNFGNMIAALTEIAYDGDLGELFDRLIEYTEYDEYLREDGREQYEIRRENIDELKSMMVNFSHDNPDMGLHEFLADIALYTDLDEMNDNEDYVSLMTVHSAKGLEFPNVYLPALEEGIFPSRQVIMGEENPEEERRLMYVAVTRAKKKLYISAAARRMLFGNTNYNPVSRFIDEIPDECLEKTDDTKRYERVSVYSSKPHSSYGGALKSASSSSGTKAAPLDYSVGDTVIHKAFGRGMVVSMVPMSNDTLVEVVFEKVGTKKIMANFAKLIKEGNE